jgi:hypothetical protein
MRASWRALRRGLAALCWLCVAAPRLAEGVASEVASSEQVASGHTFAACRSRGECERATWCWDEPRRALLQVRDAWSHITVELKGPPGGPPGFCLQAESSDSSLRVSTLRWLVQGGGSVAEVEEQLRIKSSQSADLIPWLLESLWLRHRCLQQLTLSPFGASCVRVVAVDAGALPGPLHVAVRKEGAQAMYPQALAVGYFVIMVAPLLSEQVLFYYVVGAVIGVALSVFLVSKLVLRRVAPDSNASWMAAVGLQTAFGAVAASRDYVQRALSYYGDYVLWYLLASLLGSLAATHYMLRGQAGAPSGPGRGVREIVRATIQLAGYALVLLHSSASLRWGLATALAVLTVLVLVPRALRTTAVLLDWLRPNRDVAKPVCFVAGGFISEEEYNERKVLTTQAKTTELLGSRRFHEWLLQNQHRIRLEPLEPHEGAPQDEDDEMQDE